MKNFILLLITVFSLVFFTDSIVDSVSALGQSDFSFDLHAPYNFGGDVFPGGQTRTDDFWNYMDGNICELDSISKQDCGWNEKVTGIEIIKNSGETGIVPLKVPDSQCASGDTPPCFTDQINVPGGWAWIDGPVKHADKLGLKTLMDVSLWEMWWDHAGGAVSYTQETADINALISLAGKAVNRYDGDCDVNDNGNCTDLFEGTQEKSSITYPKIDYWEIGNEPGYINWKMENTVDVGLL
jgi:hypothetical protein